MEGRGKRKEEGKRRCPFNEFLATPMNAAPKGVPHNNARAFVHSKINASEKLFISVGL